MILCELGYRNPILVASEASRLKGIVMCYGENNGLRQRL